MKLLEQRIEKDGVVLPGDILKVGDFLNQQIDASLAYELGADFARHFSTRGVTKVLTIESSGIALAVMTAYHLGCNMVFAKKNVSSNMSGEYYTAKVYSYTKRQECNIVVAKSYLTADDKVLILDDFLATGAALVGLKDLVEQAGATRWLSGRSFMMLLGQASAHAPQPTHFERSTFAMPSTMWIASNLHALVQLPRPMHAKAPGCRSR